MPRKLRVQSDEVWYHLMNRGGGKRPVFETDVDRLEFLRLLAKANERFEFEIHAYCLMGNHYHIMGHTPGANIGAVMHLIDGCYTQYFNRTRKRDGSLFRGRYHSVLVERHGHWMHLSRYIHRNPLEAGFVHRAEEYRWSSYPAYLGLVKRPKWLTIDYVMAALPSGRTAEDYRAFVEGEDWESFPHVVVGTPEADTDVSLGA